MTENPERLPNATPPLPASEGTPLLQRPKGSPEFAESHNDPAQAEELERQQDA
jgi:hypothetical protein